MTELPPAIARIADAAARPTLVFDLGAVDATMARVMAAARVSDVRVLLAVKAFPHEAVIRLAAEQLDGLDVAGPEERAAAAGVTAGIVSVTDPALEVGTLPRGRIRVTCETVAQVAAVRAAWPDAAIALRVSMSAIEPGDPAVGALQAGDGHRRSRFGVEPGAETATETDRGWRELRQMIAAARGARVGLHVHSAGVVPASPARWGAIASAVMDVARACELEPAFVDLGGSWHGVGDQLDAALAAVRAAVPAAIEVVIEPGRLFAHGAGYAIARVAATRTLADRELRVTTLSRIAHLRWSPVELVARAPAPGTGVKVTFAGATCFEDDVIGDWIVADPPPIGATVAWSGVTGYSLAWNRGFSGVPAAAIVVTS